MLFVTVFSQFMSWIYSFKEKKKYQKYRSLILLEAGFPDISQEASSSVLDFLHGNVSNKYIVMTIKSSGKKEQNISSLFIN